MTDINTFPREITISEIEVGDKIEIIDSCEGIEYRATLTVRSKDFVGDEIFVSPTPERTPVAFAKPEFIINLLAREPKGRWLKVSYDAFTYGDDKKVAPRLVGVWWKSDEDGVFRNHPNGVTLVGLNAEVICEMVPAEEEE